MGPVTALNLALHTSNRRRIYVQGLGATTDLNLTLPTDSRDGQWHQLAGLRSGSDNVNLELHTDNRVRFYVDGPSVTDLNRTAPEGTNTREGQWHHLVGQREDDTVSLYVDGQLVDSIADAAGAYSMQVADMYLGRDSRNGSTRPDGQLDNTRIWGRALSSAEIGALAAGANVVPEPSGLALFLCGSMAMAALRWRRSWS